VIVEVPFDGVDCLIKQRLLLKDPLLAGTVLADACLRSCSAKKMPGTPSQRL
jgi:hypothetical protein